MAAKEIAATILNQLGGKRFIAMTGSKQFGYTQDGENVNLTFKVGRNAEKVNYCTVIYDAGSDLYNMTFENIRMNRKTFDMTRKTIAEFSGVCCDQLEEIFGSSTGMATRL